jgi:hypothetical protein
MPPDWLPSKPTSLLCEPGSDSWKCVWQERMCPLQHPHRDKDRFPV